MKIKQIFDLRNFGFARMKILLPLIVLGASFVSLYVFEKGRPDRFQEVAKQNSELSSKYQEVLKQVTPLEKEVRELKRLVLVDKALANKERTCASTSPLSWPKQIPSGARSALANAGVRQEPSAAGKSIGRIKDYLRGVEEKNAEMQKKLDSLGVELSQKDSELQTLSEKNILLKQELDNAIAAQAKVQDAMTTEMNNLKAQILQKDADFQGALAARSSLEVNLGEINNRILSLNTQAADMQRGLQEKERAGLALEAQIKSLNEELIKDKEGKESLKDKVVQLQEALDKAAQERESLSKNFTQLQDAKKVLESQLKESLSMKDAQAGLNQQFNARISELNSSLKAFKQDADRSAQILIQKEADLNRAQKQASQLKEDFSRADKEREAIAASLKDKERALRDLQLQLQAVKDEDEKVRQRLIFLEDANSKLKSELVDISQEFELLRLDPSADPAQVQALQDKVKGLLQEKGSI